VAQTYQGANSGRSRARVRPKTVRARLPVPLWAFMLVMMLPHTIAFYAGPVLVTGYRLVMIVMAVPILLKLTSGRFRLALPDALLASFSAWSLLCIVTNFPVEQSLERGGQFFLEVTLAYFVSRAYISNLDEIYALIRPLFIIVVIAFVLAVPESISHRKPIIELTSELSGIGTGFYYEGTDIRLGLRRAQAFFENPILYGLFCATSLSLVWFAEEKLRPRLAKAALIAGATFVSLSSAPLLAMSSQFVMIGIEAATRSMRNRVPIVLSGVGILIVALQLFTNSGPIGIIINYLTFNQASSYNRVLIWDFGLQNINAHPIFGMVPENWERASWMKVSIDNFWIYTGLISGYVGWGLLAAGLIMVIWRFNAIPLKLLTPRHIAFRRGWTLMMIAFALTGFSVMFFGKMQPYFYFMLGIGAAAASIYAEHAKLAMRAQRDAMRARRVPPMPDEAVPA